MRGRGGRNKEADFEEADCESDYEDQLDSLRQAKRRKREETLAKENKRVIRSTYLPSSGKKLSACVTCKLVLNKEKREGEVNYYFAQRTFYHMASERVRCRLRP